VIFDHDAKFNGDVIAFLKATGLNPKRTSIQAPWQNERPSGGLGVVGASFSTTSSR
jgi:hypothetical protein